MAASPIRMSQSNHTLNMNPGFQFQRQPSAGPSRSRRSKSARPPIPALSLGNPEFDPQNLPTTPEFVCYPEASPTPEPQRSGPADPQDLGRAAASIRLLYDHDKKFVETIASLKTRTAYIKTKTATLRDTVIAHRGLRERLENYIKYWKPIDENWSAKDWFGDQPFRASFKGNGIRKLADDEASDEDEPRDPHAMPTLIRDPNNGAYPSVEAHLAKYPHLHPAGSPKSPEPSSSAHPQTQETAPISTAIAPSSSNQLESTSQTKQTSPHSVFAIPQSAKSKGKRRRSSSTPDVEEQQTSDEPRPTKRRNIAQKPRASPSGSSSHTPAANPIHSEYHADRRGRSKSQGLKE